MVLPHLLEKSSYYERFYQNRARNGDTIIVDNGVAEGSRYSLSDVYDMTIAMGPNAIMVLPDELRKADKTLKMIHDGIQRTRGIVKTMAVVQGLTEEECLNSIKEMLKMNFTMWGIPRHLPITTGIWNIRAKLAEIINARTLYKAKIHLLGCNRFEPYEIKRTVERCPFIVGVDTSHAVDCAVQRVQVDSFCKREDGWDDLGVVEVPVARLVDNIQTLNGWVNAEQA